MSESIVDLLSQGRERAGQASKIFGLVVGIVTNNKDPDKLGRVKVKFPWLDDKVESWWARLAYPMGGKQRGFWWIPEVEDEVLVGFEHGDVRFPYIVGSLYNGVDTPPQANDITSGFAAETSTGEYSYGGYSCGGRDFNEDGANDLRFIRSRSGHLIILDDKSGKEKITIADKTGKHRLEIFTDKKNIVITSEDGNVEIFAGKTVKISCEKLVTHTTKDTEMKVDGDMKVTVKKSLTEKADMSISRKAGMDLTQESGTSTEIKSGTSMAVTGGTTADVKGTLKLTCTGLAADYLADTIVTIKGAMVMIN